MRDWPFMFAVGLVDIGDAGRLRTAPGPVVAGVGPELASLGFASARIEHRRPCLVGEEFDRGLQDLEQELVHETQREGGAARPVGQRRAIEFDALAAIDLGLPVERQMVGVFGDDDRRDQIFRWNATLDQMLGRRSLGHLALANAAGVFGPVRHDHLEARRDHVEPFRDILADFDAKAVAAWAALVGDIDDDVLARQVFRQRPTIDLALARPLRHCEEPLRRSNPGADERGPDCFASLAMTGAELAR